MKVLRLEMTPNPNAIKFVLDGPIVAIGARQYENAAAAEGDAVATKIFALKGVQSVFYLDTFITVDRTGPEAWDEVRGVIESAVSDLKGPLEFAASGDDEEIPDDELLTRINGVLDEMVRPALAGDGGGLQVVGLRGHDVIIRYQGACGSCPSSIAGTLFAIQNLLRAEVSDELNVISA
jgi:NFU1 iron-sulfur cluster scaffold homolog, mitochondrial